MVFGFFKRRRRNKARQKPFSPEWSAIIDENFPYAAKLTPKERKELHGHIQVLVEEKEFVGCGGLEMTDEIKISVAAQAALLLVNRNTDYYPNLHSILVYPSAYVGKSTRAIPGGGVVETEETRLGESWSSGQIVLSWDDTLRGAANMEDGHNVVLHEFAHQLDGEFSASDGAPVLPKRSMYTAWARVLGEEYEKLIEDLHRRHKTVIDSYGATNPAEFFAVVTETFFERPQALKKRHPELYEQMAAFYKQDPEARYE